MNTDITEKEKVNVSYNKDTSQSVPHARIIFILIGVIIVISCLVLSQSLPVAPFEREYLNSTPPAYHMTPVKWITTQLSNRGLSITTLRVVLLPLKFVALLSLFILFQKNIGRRALIALIGFILIPQTLSHLVLLDPWMDSVAFILLGILLLDKRWVFLAGILFAFSIDAKTTSLLSLIPFLIITCRKYSVSNWLKCVCGFLIYFILFQFSWVIHPSQAVEHVTFWRAQNISVEYMGFTYTKLPVMYVLHIIGASVPTALLICFFAGIVGARKEYLLMTIFPVCFFMFYREYSPDGLRHYFLVLPFLSVVAVNGWYRMHKSVKVILAIWILLSGISGFSNIDYRNGIIPDPHVISYKLSPGSKN